MAIKIRKDGVVQDLVINANEVRVLDKDGNFRSKNLETVLKELNMNGGSGGGTGTGGSGYPKDAEYVYVKDSEPDMDGVWFDESDVSSQPIVGDNSVVKAIREYIDTDVKETVVKNDGIVKDIKEKVGDKLDVVSELAKPNLIVNGGFSVWQKSKSMTMNSVGFCADNIHLGYVNATHIATVSKQDFGILTEFNSWATKRTLEYYVLIPSDIIRPLRKKKVTISCQLDMEHSVLFKTMNKHISAFFSTDDETTCGIGCTVNRIEDANVYQAFDIEETNGFMEITIDIPENASALSLRFGVGLGNITDEELAQITTCKLAYNYFKLEVGDKATPFIPKPYVQELSECNKGVTGANPNILLNPNFKVKQRSEFGTSWTHTNKRVYTFDRWRTGCDYGSLKVDALQNSIKLTTTTDNNDIILNQPWTIGEIDLRGKTVTLSCKARTNCDSTLHIYYKDGGWKSVNTKIINDGVTIVTGTIPTTATMFNIELNTPKVPTGSFIEVEWIKLEFGEVATPFHERTYGEELSLCERFYEVSDYDVWIAGYKNSSVYGFEYQYNTPKRVKPTIQYGNTKTADVVYLVAPNNMKNVTPTQINVDTRKFRLCVAHQTNDNILVGGNLGCIGWFKMDAEIY